jgi:hypothetical protein
VGPAYDVPANALGDAWDGYYAEAVEPICDDAQISKLIQVGFNGGAACALSMVHAIAARTGAVDVVDLVERLADELNTTNERMLAEVDHASAR